MLVGALVCALAGALLLPYALAEGSLTIMWASVGVLIVGIVLFIGDTIRKHRSRPHQD